jgi:hypothetical protein
VWAQPLLLVPLLVPLCPSALARVPLCLCLHTLQKAKVLCGQQRSGPKLRFTFSSPFASLAYAHRASVALHFCLCVSKKHR